MATPGGCPSRRSLLLEVLGSAAAGGIIVAGCSDGRGTMSGTGNTATGSSEATTQTSTRGASQRRPRVLLAYFSRAGQNYYYEDRIDLKVGNTQVLVEMIADRIDCDMSRIEAADRYSDDYDATVRRNVQEQDADARPAITGQLPDVAGYDVVLLASPIWNVRPPMIMKTFAESLDFTDTRVHPVVTYAVSGLGTAERDYRKSCHGATIGRALAVQGEKVAESGRAIDSWLRATGLRGT